MIPYFKQKTVYTCGPASMRMVLASLGIRKTEKSIAKLLRVHPQKGLKNNRFPQFAEESGLKYIMKSPAKIDDIKELLKKKYGVIVNIQIFGWGRMIGHFAVVEKIRGEYIFIHDPNLGPSKKYLIKDFIKIWRGDPRGDNKKHWLIGIKK